MQTVRGKEFLKRTFKDMLKRRGIQFHVCRNRDVKCADVERAHRTIRNKLYRYSTYKNTNRFVDVLPRLVKAYNNIHSANGFAPGAVNNNHVLEICTRMNNKHSRVRLGGIKFRVGQHFWDQ